MLQRLFLCIFLFTSTVTFLKPAIELVIADVIRNPENQEFRQSLDEDFCKRSFGVKDENDVFKSYAPSYKPEDLKRIIGVLAVEHGLVEPELSLALRIFHYLVCYPLRIHALVAGRQRSAPVQINVVFDDVLEFIVRQGSRSDRREYSISLLKYLALLCNIVKSNFTRKSFLPICNGEGGYYYDRVIVLLEKINHLNPSSLLATSARTEVVSPAGTVEGRSCVPSPTLQAKPIPVHSRTRSGSAGGSDCEPKVGSAPVGGLLDRPRIAGRGSTRSEGGNRLDD